MPSVCSTAKRGREAWYIIFRLPRNLAANKVDHTVGNSTGLASSTHALYHDNMVLNSMHDVAQDMWHPRSVIDVSCQ